MDWRKEIDNDIILLILYKYSLHHWSSFIIDPSYKYTYPILTGGIGEIVVQSDFSASLREYGENTRRRHEIQRTKAWKKRKIEETKTVPCYFTCKRTTDEELKLIRRKDEYNNERRTLRWNVCRENDDDSHSFFHFVLEISKEKQRKRTRLGYS